MGAPKNTVTTQPMSMARPSAPPIPPSSKNRSTQRLVVTPNAAAKMTSALPVSPASATINLPAGMILRCLPPELLAADLTQFEASGTAATEIGLPMDAILNQLPSGKVELPLQDLVAQFPAGFLKSDAEVAPYLGTLINLPLMDVVMRIPPDLLSVRPDQKSVDTGHMTDPFTEDTLRQKPVTSGQANIVDESQVAHDEEFVPQAASASPTSTHSFVPPARNPNAPLLHQTRSLSGKAVAPVRSTTPMPGHIPPPPVIPAGEVPMPPRPPQLSASQMLGVPRPSMAPPAPSPVITTTSGPLPPRISTPGVPQIPPVIAAPNVPPPAPFTFTVPSTPAVPPAPVPATPASIFAATIPMARPIAPEEPVNPPAPDQNSDELQRLAALAMAETGDKPLETEMPGASAPESALAAPSSPSAFGMRPSAVPPPPAKVESGFSATSRFGLPESPARELAQTAPVAPAPSAAAKETGRLPGRPELTPRSITTRVTPPSAPPVSETQPASAATAINLNNCSSEDLLPIPGISPQLAAAIVRHRDKIGEFHRLDELLDVPGMTREAYSNLTGEAPPTGLHPTVNELLGFPPEKELSLKDVTDRIACWPDVTGCLLSQKNGLALVGTAPDFLDRQAIVAFAPRIFEDLNKSFDEITGKTTEELVIPTTGTSFHLMRDKDLYLIILSRVPQMPDRHLKIARMVLAGLSVRPS